MDEQTVEYKDILAQMMSDIKKSYISADFEAANQILENAVDNVIDQVLKTVVDTGSSTAPDMVLTDYLYSSTSHTKLKMAWLNCLKGMFMSRCHLAEFYYVLFESLLKLHQDNQGSIMSDETGYLAGCLITAGHVAEQAVSQNFEAISTITDMPKHLFPTEDEWKMFLKKGVLYLKLHRTFCSNKTRHATNSFVPARGVSLISGQAFCFECICEEMTTLGKTLADDAAKEVD